MCTVSDKLKLCTCKTESVERLKNYWVLKRPNGRRLKQESSMLYGVYFLPEGISMYHIRQNWALLLTMLNERNCFDIKLPIRENDILELHFTFNGTPFSYEFEYKKKEWKIAERYKICTTDKNIQNGKITTPFLTARQRKLADKSLLLKFKNEQKKSTGT